MIKIHHAKRARSARIIWLLEELGVPYELHQIEFSPDALQSPEHLKLHPLGQLPVIEDDGLTMIESGAILEYLLERYAHGRLAPAPGTAERPEYLQWFHYGEASLTRYVTDIVRARFGQPESTRCPEVVPFARERLKQALAPVDKIVATREFITGSEFTAADLMVGYGIVMARIIGELPAEYAGVAAYLGRLKQRPSYAKAWG